MTTTRTATRKDFLVFGAPDIREEEIREVVDCLEGGWIGSGPRVAKFERAFAEYKSAPHAVALNSCTAALHLSLIASGVGPGDEVITTPLTFCATVNAIIHAGATPVLADVDSKTMNIDPVAVEERITDKTRALVPVHFAGNPADMDALVAVSRRHNLKLIEDCAHAIETEYRGEKVGTFGDFGCFSFYVTKNVTTGEGGMMITSDEASAARIKELALHGLSVDAWAQFGDTGYKHYYVGDVGFKYNMMDLQAAIGLHQLDRVETSWKRRREIWQRYNEGLSGLPIDLPPDAGTGSRHSHHLYTILVDPKRCGIDRDTFLEEMAARNIGVGVHYVSIPEHPYYHETFGWRPDEFPNARRIGRQTASLPVSPALSDDDVEDVVAAVTDAVETRPK